MKELTENQKKWVEALRSGEYIQGKDTLQKNETYCCLGVACKVAEKDGIKLSLKSEYEINGLDLNAQTEVLNWLGLKNESGSFDGPRYIKGEIINSLTGLNDTAEYSFEQIADFIEANAEELFE